MLGEGKSVNSVKRVLVVDDNLMSRKVILLRLEQNGYAATAAASGAEALEAVERDPADLIFLDLIMEGMDGMAVLSALKENDQYKDIPVVIISGVEEADAVQKCLDAGASDFLHKPVTADLLKEVVGDLIGAAANVSGGGEAERLDLAAMPIIDPSYIRQLQTDYGAEAATGFVVRFQDLVPGQQSEIAESVGNLEACRRAASSLKGGARTLGLLQLAGACREIERACNDNNDDDVRAGIETLNGYLEQALQALRSV